MTVMELASCRVHEDPTSALAGGCIVSCTVFYEGGFGVPSHQFLRLLLQFYGLELHHLTPSGMLHIAAFMTLCEVYMGIEPHFDLWNYFFRARLQQGSNAKAMVWAVWTSLSDPGWESIHTFAFRCPTLRSDGKKYGSF
jgi:hypothetical protein